MALITNNMKKATLLFLLVGATALAQSVTIKMGYKPNTTYRQTQDQKVATEISYGEGMEPMKQDGASKTTSVTKTGKLTNNIIPFTTELELDAESAAAAQIPKGTKLYGKTDVNGVPKFDSIHAPGMNPQIKDMLVKMMQSNLSQSIIPQKTVKVGESFVVDTPFELPMGPVTMNMQNKTTYKLIKIEGKKAHFDLSSVYTLTTKVEGQDMKGSGTAMGSMIYDTDAGYPTQMNTITDMTMAFKAQGMDMNLKTKVDLKQNTQVTPAK